MEFIGWRLLQRGNDDMTWISLIFFKSSAITCYYGCYFYIRLFCAVELLYSREYLAVHRCKYFFAG